MQYADGDAIVATARRRRQLGPAMAQDHWRARLRTGGQVEGLMVAGLDEVLGDDGRAPAPWKSG